VVLAAGIGQRFGGLKQLTPIGPGGEAIMDYTVHDALRSGFDRVVLVIRGEIEDAIRTHVDRGFGHHVEVEFVHQRVDDVPAGFTVPAGRVRPWGTGQAVLAAGPCLRGPFAVANADDLYGAPAIAAVGAFLSEPSTIPPEWAAVGFPVGTTLPINGAVSRAFITVEHGQMRSIDEILEVRRHPDGACWNAEDGVRTASGDALVSMNLWGFSLDVLLDLHTRFRRFLASDPGADREFLLPVIMGQAVGEGVARVRVLPTTSGWCGMTASEDRRIVKAELARLVAEGAYPGRLWS
ncbi:MAG: NTP transferase domain-containing protein, partial [Planctomycetota bacterium]